MRPDGITDRPVPPWELPGAFRRDGEPHRRRLVVALGQAAFGLTFLLGGTPLALLPVLPWTRAWEFPEWWGLPLLPLLGIPPSLAAWALARHDLALIRRGHMDPAGEQAMRIGRWWGYAGMVLAALFSLLSSLVWLMLWRVY